jgi:hypothetical protein
VPKVRTDKHGQQVEEVSTWLPIALATELRRRAMKNMRSVASEAAFLLIQGLGESGDFDFDVDEAWDKEG